ncbi:MAG: hypothetical protein HYX87_09240 [Chloroflexi bacterium]|nr:hypothetical protein [Chloroflexota bacterium]
MRLDRRLELLEKISRINEREVVWLVVVYDRSPGISAATEAEKEAAIARYKSEHPDWESKDFNIVYVVSERGKEMTERVIRGERT